MEQDLILASPGTFAALTSEGRWKMARHLAYLNRTLLTAIKDAQAGLLDGLVVSMPPQHGKSELISKYLPAWYLMNFPDRRVILTSYEADFAAQWGRKTRDLIDQYGPMFGVQVSRRSSAVYRWDIQGREGGMTTAGAGGPITGRGAHLLIVDDPVKNDEEARSAPQREKQWGWWQTTATTRIRPGGLFVIVQTRWHRDDLAGRILREAKTNGQRWREVKLPALAEEGDPLGRALGEPLWPDVYNREHFERVRSSLTNYIWRAMYQQDPIAEGGTEWPESYFGDSIWFDEFPTLTDGSYRVMALDPSKGKDVKTGDYSAFVMMQVMPAERRAYVDADLEVRNISLIVNRAIDLTRTFRPNGFMIETNQFQELLATEIARRGHEVGCQLPIFHCENQAAKIVRIRSLTSLLTRGELRFKRGSRGARLLVDQLRDFPYGDHDDGPDALEMAWRLAGQLVFAPPDCARHTTEFIET
jgi:predicted phage terminase large subunit-like protein